MVNRLVHQEINAEPKPPYDSIPTVFLRPTAMPGGYPSTVFGDGQPVGGRSFELIASVRRMGFGDPWSEEQSALADVLLVAWSQNQQWPIFQFVRSELGRRGVKDVIGVLNSFPTFGARTSTTRSYCDVTFDHTYSGPPADSPVGLSISGLARHPVGEQFAQMFVAVLRYAADKYEQTPMDATKVVEVEVSSTELGHRPGFGWPKELVDASGQLVETEWPSGVTRLNTGQDGATWSIGLSENILRYSGATVDSYIAGIKRDIEAAASEMSKWYGSASHEVEFQQSNPSEVSVPSLDPRRARAELQKLKEMALEDSRVRAASPTHAEWKARVRTVMERALGTNSSVLADFNNISYHIGIWTGAPGEAEEDRRYFASKIDSAIAYIDAAVYALELEFDPESATSVPAPSGIAGTGTIFLVHGHDDGLKASVARLLERATQAAVVILHEHPDEGKTIIEKFEAHAETAIFAVVLLTPDDDGRVSGADDWTPRARQNVVLEHGYFIGRLGRSRVVALYKDGVELPSDLSGLLYKEVDNHDAWKLALAKELHAAQIKVDFDQIV